MSTRGDGLIAPPGLGGKFERDPDRPGLVKAFGEDTAGGRGTVGRGGGGALHVHHDADELLYVLEGRFRFRLGERIVSGAAGTLTFVPRGLPHNWQNIGLGHRRIFVVLASAGFEKCLEEVSAMRFRSAISRH